MAAPDFSLRLHSGISPYGYGRIPDVHRLDGGRTVEIEIFDARGALISRA